MKRNKSYNLSDVETGPDAVMDAKIERAQKKSIIWAIVQSLAVALLVAYVAFGLVLGLGYVSGNSMHPIMNDGDLVVYLRLDGSFEVGDVVLYRHPTDGLLVKRVVGVAGDLLDIDERGTLLHNGVPSPIEVFYETHAVPGGMVFPFMVLPDTVVLMGDKRDTSADSRATGAVPLDDIKGRVLLLIRKRF